MTDNFKNPPGPAGVRRRIRWIALAIALCLTAAVFITAWRRSDLVAPPPSLLLLDRNGEYLAQINDAGKAGYGFWPLSNLPPRVVAATLALEDHRFQEHPGVDPVAILRAFWQNITSRQRVSGASTIAMQVARMQYPGPRTYPRKALEALTAVLMTLRHGRRQVLAHYLRIVPYGNQGHGIAYAARRYLDKPVADLSFAEIAFLAAIPQAPGRMNPFGAKGRRLAIRRGLRILTELHAQQVFSDTDLVLAERQIRNIRIPPLDVRPECALHLVIELENQRREMLTKAIARNDYRLFSTLDLALQQRVSRLASAHLAAWRSCGAGNLAVIVARRDTLEVLAWLGSADYFDSAAGAFDFTRIARSPGSALKPFIYGLALDRGTLRPNTILDDLPEVAQGIENADQGFLGPLLPRQALANSRNVPAVNLLKTVGIDETYVFFRELGLHRDARSADAYGTSLALGGMPVTLADLVQAYGALANDGLLRKFRFFGGKSAGKAAHRVLSADTARLISLFLSDPMARLPMFPRMGAFEYPFAVAVKTGTSQGYRDAWALGYSRDYLVGVWVGRDDNRPMKSLGGSSSAARLLHDILLALHPEALAGTSDLSFPPPEDYEPREICRFSGKRRTEACAQHVTEWLAPDARLQPDRVCRIRTVDKRNGLLATPWTPADQKEERIFVALAPRYAAWAKARNLPLPPPAFSPLDLPQGVLMEAETSEAVGGGLQLDAPVRLAILSPADGTSLFANPEVPPDMQSLALKAVSAPDVRQVLWLVDNQPFALADAPFTVRWPLEPGRHTFQVRLPFRDEASAKVTVRVN